MCIIRSTYLPPGKGRVLEVQLKSQFSATDSLLFEPHQLLGLDAPEAVVTHNDGKILIAVENNASLSARLEPGQCVGTVTPIDFVPLKDNSEAAEAVSPTQKQQDSANGPLSVVTNGGTHENERLERLFTALSLESGNGLTDQQVQALKKMIADVFALDDTELGHTELVQHQVDTGDTTPIKQPVRRVFRDKIAAMVDEMDGG